MIGAVFDQGVVVYTTDTCTLSIEGALVHVPRNSLTGEVRFEGRWRHKEDGTVYTVDRCYNVGCTNEDFPLMVAYGGEFACTAASFYSRMEKVND